MKTYYVKFTVKVDNTVSDEDVEEWIKYSLHETPQIKLTNPLCENDLDAEFGSIEID